MLISTLIPLLPFYSGRSEGKRLMGNLTTTRNSSKHHDYMEDYNGLLPKLATQADGYTTPSTADLASDLPCVPFCKNTNSSSMQSHTCETKEGNVSKIVARVQCRESCCMEYLTPSEKIAIKACERLTLVKFHVPADSFRKPICNFMNGNGRSPVALASTEGSGNTWIRGLLEQVTGICTGFEGCDFKMRQYGFIGEGVKSGSVLVIKTHEIAPMWSGKTPNTKQRTSPYPQTFYGSAVFILRNPHDSLIAEWNRRATNHILIKRKLPHNESHTNVIPEELFREL